MAPNDNKGNIPAWQRATSLPGAEDVKVEVKVSADEPKDETKDEQQAPEAKETEEPNTATGLSELRQQATQFLNDPNIKNAPRERKVVFLRSKGLKDEGIDLLLSSQDAKVAPSAPEPAPAKRDIPPVITYPEFLLHSQKPPPLVTKTRLLNTIYATAGLYGTLYAFSKYIINPMQAQLSDARHEFFTESNTQLEVLNTRLSELVSTVPPSRPGTAKTLKDEDRDDDASEDSDPTELFHRDIGTQTSPALSRRTSVSSSTTSTSPLDRQESQLKILASHLQDLSSSSEKRTETEDEVNTQLSQLITNLNEMAYTSSSYYRYGAVGSTYSWGGTAGEKKEDDEIERLVKDVKALKGRFLGVKNFPRVGVR